MLKQFGISLGTLITSLIPTERLLKLLTRVGRLILATIIGNLAFIMLMLFFAVKTQGVHAASSALPLMANTLTVTHSTSTTHQMHVFGNGRITNRYLSDNGQNQIDGDGNDITATTIAIMFDEHSPAYMVDVGVQGDFYTTTFITLNDPSSIPGYSEDSQVIYASKVLSYQITQRTLTTDTVYNDWLIMELDIINTGTIFLTGGKLLYMIDIDAAEHQVSDEGYYDSMRRLVLQIDENDPGYAMGVSLLKGNLRGYGIVGNGYPGTDIDIKNELITPTNAITDGDNDVSWLIVDIPILSPGQQATVAFGLCAKTGGDKDEARTNLTNCIDQIVREPALIVDKIGPSTADVNETVTYTFTVRHSVESNGSPVNIIDIKDDKANPVGLVSGDTNHNTKLDGNEIWVYTATCTIQPTDPHTLTNTVIVTGTDEGGSSVITATDTHTTIIEHGPILRISKDGPITATVGETVAYEFEVRHSLFDSDDSPVINLVVSDSIAGIASLDLGNSIGAGDGILDEGDRWLYTATYTIQPTDPNFLVNVGTVQGKDSDGDDVTASDTHSLDIEFKPVLTIVKDGPEIANIGDTLVFTYTITNNDITGDGSPIHDVIVGDNLIGSVTNRQVISGNTDWLLERDEIWVFTATYTVPPTNSKTLVNTSMVQGRDKDNDTITAIAIHTTTLLPALKVVKTGPDVANVNDPVGFTFTVTNDDIRGNGVPIKDVSVNDSLIGPVTNRQVISGDGPPFLEVGEIWVYTASYTIQPNDPHFLTNIVTATGMDEDDNPIAPIADNHTITVEHSPALFISKAGWDTADVGDTVIYQFTVWNDFLKSDFSPVSNVSVIDNIAGPATLVSGDTNDNNRLDENEHWNYTVTYIIKPTDPDPLENTSTVTGVDLDSDDIDPYSDSHSLNVEYNPALAIIKDGPDTAEIGETVVYTFAVSHATNSDQSRISNMIVSDTIIGPIVTTPVISGNFDDYLDMGEVWVYTASHKIQSVEDPLTNIATVKGWDRNNDIITATATHSINLLPVLTGTIDGPSTARIGDTVIFTLTVCHNTNSDGSPVIDVTVEDNIGGLATPVNGDENGNSKLDLGESWVYTVSCTIPSISGGSLPHWVTVVGEDEDGHEIIIIIPYNIRPISDIYLPMTFRNFVYAPDLIVDEITATSNAVIVTIKNVGNRPVSDRFWVDFYVDPNPPPTGVHKPTGPGQIWPYLCDYGIAWDVNASIPPGDTLTLTIGDSYYSQDYSNFPPPVLSEGTAVYAQVDSTFLNSNPTNYGNVLEIHEIIDEAYNNISSNQVEATSNAINNVEVIPLPTDEFLPIDKPNLPLDRPDLPPR